MADQDSRHQNESAICPECGKQNRKGAKYCEVDDCQYPIALDVALSRVAKVHEKDRRKRREGEGPLDRLL